MKVAEGKNMLPRNLMNGLEGQSHYVTPAKAGAGKSADSPLIPLWV